MHVNVCSMQHGPWLCNLMHGFPKSWEKSFSYASSHSNSHRTSHTPHGSTFGFAACMYTIMLLAKL